MAIVSRRVVLMSLCAGLVATSCGTKGPAAKPAPKAGATSAATKDTSPGAPARKIFVEEVLFTR